MLKVIQNENEHLKSFIHDSNLCSSTLYIRYTLCYTEQSENATLQYFIFCEKVLDEKYLLKLNNVFQTNNSSKLHQFVSFYVWAMFLFVFKALFTEFCNCACTKKIVMPIRICQTCVA